MKRVVLSALLVGLGVSLIQTPMVACGDKLLVLGRGVRFQRAFAAVHPASILVFRPRAAATSDAIKEFDSTLKDAGHKLQTVEDAAALTSALKSGTYDLVLVDLAAAQGLEPQVQSANSKPTLLPFAVKASKADVATAKQRYGSLLSIPSKSGEYLAAIDRVMETRRSGKPGA